MHATYCFLYNKDQGFSLDWRLDEFNFDENNWYQAMCSVDKQGNVENLCPDDDWRGRDRCYKSLEELPPEKRWDEALKFAEAVYKHELNQTLLLLYSYDEQKYTEVDANSPKAFEAAIRKALAETAETTNSYAISKASHALTSLKYCHWPFSEIFDNPYNSLRTFVDYNNFEYEEDPLESENAAIVIYDIHT